MSQFHAQHVEPVIGRGAISNPNHESLMNLIGKPIPRKEGRRKVTGQALYVDDLTFPSMLHGVTVRSSVARGRIKSISFEGDIPWDEFTIVTAKDIRGESAYGESRGGRLAGENYVALILND